MIMKNGTSRSAGTNHHYYTLYLCRNKIMETIQKKLVRHRFSYFYYFGSAFVVLELKILFKTFIA